MADAYEAKVSVIGDAARRFEKQIMLQILDQLWKEHLATMDHLRQGIGLRSYAGRNPKQEYKREAFELFKSMLQNMKEEFVKFMSLVELQAQDDPDAIEKQRRAEAESEVIQASHPEAGGELAAAGSDTPDAAPSQQPVTRDGRKVGRNEPCPCGSGKKFKQCHGKVGS